MKIIVEGNGEKTYKPNQVVLTFDFRTADVNYNKSLELGVKNVEEYLEMLISMGFEKESFKTQSFRVSEDRHYDEQTRKYIKDGFVFTQCARIKFDFDMAKLSTLMEKTAELKNPPIYKITFNVKDEKQANEELLGLAYEDALFQATAIAKASGTTITGCKRVSFQPFDFSENLSNSMLDGAIMSKAKCCSAGTSESIQNTFIPEDVVLGQTVYCEFDAE